MWRHSKCCARTTATGAAGPFAIDDLANFDLDLRLSSARVNIANARLGRTGVAANLRDARLTLAIGEAQAYGGVLKGAFVLSKTETGADVKSQLQFTDVDLESCLGELFAIRKLEGKGNLSLVGRGVRRQHGGAHTHAGGYRGTSGPAGRDHGFNVEQLLKRLEQRPLSIGGDFRRGRTPFERLTATAKIVQGMATIEEMRARGRRGPPRASADRPRSRRATSICAARRRWFPQRPMPRPCSNCRSWCRARGTTRSCCPTRRA